MTENKVKIKKTFAEITAETTLDGRVKVTKQKRKHKFGEGYQTVGPKRELYSGHTMDAALVAEVLKDMFESEQ